MAHHHDDTGTNYTDHVDRAWELADQIGFAMFITWDGERQRARPLAAHVDRDEHAIYFLIDIDSQSDDQAERFPVVTLAFADTAHHHYVSITGEAEISNDREKIRELFSPFAKAWWDGPDDPAIRLITVRPDDAELWDAPGKIVSGIKMLTAAVTGGRPDVGTNAKVQL